MQFRIFWKSRWQLPVLLLLNSWRTVYESILKCAKHYDSQFHNPENRNGYNMKRKNAETPNLLTVAKKLALQDAMPVNIQTAIDEDEVGLKLGLLKCAEKRKLVIVSGREGRTFEDENEFDFIRRKQIKLNDTVLSTRVRNFTEKNKVEVVDAPKVSVPLYHAWKLPTATLKSTLEDEADSSFNSFNFWREALPQLEEECSTINYGDFSWWRVTPPDIIDLDVISDDSE